jgi:hypothetical protein
MNTVGWDSTIRQHAAVVTLPAFPTINGRWRDKRNHG